MPETIDAIELPSDLTALSGEQLDELQQTAFAVAKPLADKVDDLTDDELDTLTRLGDVVSGVKGERERRLAEASAATDRAAKASAAAAVFANEPEKTDPVVKPSVAQVAAAGTAPADVDTGTQVDGQPGRESYTRMLSANGAPGMTPGTEFKDFKAVGKVLEDAMAAFGNLGEGVGPVRTNVVAFRRDYPAELRIEPKDSLGTIMDKLDAVAKEPEGGLVAAAGWCAPSEILYDLFELENGTDGIIDLPELQIHRGGVQVTPGPDFSTIFSGAGYWHQTEAQVIAATSKPTMSIACPSFTDNRLEVEGVQITGAFLQDRGYPELVQRFARGAMVAHQRKLNIFAINKIANNSTVFDYTSTTNMPVTTTEFKDLTVLSRLLAIMGTQIMDYRYKYRMAFKASLEVVLPFWVLEPVRADIARRMAIDLDDAFSVAEEQLTRWFALRGARLQLVYDWQETLNSTGSPNTATTLGQTAGIYTMPTTIYALLYAAGTWVRGVADVIRLDTVYDSTNLALNQYIRLFTEDGIQVIKRGFESRMIKTTIDPSGTVSASVNMVTG